MRNFNQLKRSHPLRMLLVALIPLVLQSCGSTREELEEKRKPFPLENFNAQVTFDRQWSRKVGDGNGKYHQKLLAYSDERKLCVAGSNGKLSCIGSNGKKLWSTNLKVELTAGVGGSDSYLWVVSKDGDLITLDASSGDVLWRYEIGDSVLAAPAGDDNIVAVQTLGGRLIGIDVDNQQHLWEYKSDEPLLTLYGTATPVLENGMLYTGFGTGKLAIFRLSDGKIQWDHQLAVAKGDSDIEKIVDIDASPLITENAVYAASYNGNLFAFNKSNGRPRWRFETSSYRQVTEGLNKIYLVDEFSRLFAVASESGDERWSQDALKYRRLSAPIVYSGYLVAADYDGYIHVFSQLNGQIIGRKRIDGAGVNSPLLEWKDNLIVISDDGKVVAYQLESK